MDCVDKLPRKKRQAFTREEQEIIKDMSQDLIGTWTLWAAKITAWILFFVVTTILVAFIVALVR
jgi:hypothetical protein